ncbi:MAG: beta-lactamase family protein [Marinibacterium sp.]|nr:beta-lactamase family protein [Marinibacterium sp.]
MMRPLQGPAHTVVGFDLQSGDARFIKADAVDAQGPCDALIFEIGSITKVFTGILLCLLVEDGTVDPCAPLRDMSDDLSDVPHWITPQNLVSHTSGLPPLYMPLWKAAITPMPDGPYATFSRSDLLAWFGAWSGRDPGPAPRHVYSNFGAGLLGEAMAMQAGRPFVDLLADRVLDPLGLTDTTGGPHPDLQTRFMQPRTTRGRAVAPWLFQALAGAGCLRSSARDLVRFCARVIAALSGPETLLDHAICRSALPIFGLGRRDSMAPTAQCAGWMATTPTGGGPRMIHASGGTAGSTCAIYVCPDKAAACGVLSNNGVAASLWAGARLGWSDPPGQAQRVFAAI